MQLLVALVALLAGCSPVASRPNPTTDRVSGRSLAASNAATMTYTGYLIKSQGLWWLILDGNSRSLGQGTVQLLFGPSVQTSGLYQGLHVKVTATAPNALLQVQVASLAILGGVTGTATASQAQSSVNNSSDTTDSSQDAGPNPINKHTGKFSSLTVLLDVCNTPPTTTLDRVKAIMQGPVNPDPDAPLNTFSSFIEKCSFGRMTYPLTSTQNVVLEAVVPIRGAAVCSNTINPCDQWMDIGAEAENYMRKTLGMNLNTFGSILYVMPAGLKNCQVVAGQAMTNCYPSDSWGGSWSGFCRSWYVGELYPSVVAHEVGHNFGLGHAALDGNPYGDLSCPMATGAWNPPCYNVVHSASLGWVDPLAVLGADDLVPGAWVELGLPPRSAGPDNYVLIQSETAPGVGDRDVYLSYTAPVGTDTFLAPGFSNLVEVQSWNLKSTGLTDLLAMVRPGSQASVGGSGTRPRLVVRVAAASPSGPTPGAVVQVCRATTAGHCTGTPPPTRIPVGTYGVAGSTTTATTTTSSKSAGSSSSSKSTAKVESEVLPSPAPQADASRPSPSPPSPPSPRPPPRRGAA